MAPSWSERWQRVKADLTLNDLLLDIAGKMLVGVGIGALYADAIRPSLWCFIGSGIILSLLIKAKYSKRFWS